VIIEESGGLEGEDVEAEPRIYPILFLICPSIFLYCRTTRGSGTGAQRASRIWLLFFTAHPNHPFKARP